MKIDLVCIGRVRLYSLSPHQGQFLIRNTTTEADEAYVIGKRGQYTPVGAYLAGDEIIKIALQHGVQMIHPGKTLFSQCLEGG